MSRQIRNKIKAKMIPPKCAKCAIPAPLKKNVKAPMIHTRYFAFMDTGGINNLISMFGNIIPNPMRIPYTAPDAPNIDPARFGKKNKFISR